MASPPRHDSAQEQAPHGTVPPHPTARLSLRERGKGLQPLAGDALPARPPDATCNPQGPLADLPAASSLHPSPAPQPSEDHTPYFWSSPGQSIAGSPRPMRLVPITSCPSSPSLQRNTGTWLQTDSAQPSHSCSPPPNLFVSGEFGRSTPQAQPTHQSHYSGYSQAVVDAATELVHRGDGNALPANEVPASLARMLENSGCALVPDDGGVATSQQWDREIADYASLYSTTMNQMRQDREACLARSMRALQALARPPASSGVYGSSSPPSVHERSRTNSVSNEVPSHSKAMDGNLVSAPNAAELDASPLADPPSPHASAAHRGNEDTPSTTAAHAQPLTKTQFIAEMARYFQ